MSERAMMSEPATWASPERVLTLAPALDALSRTRGAAAEREARRILAETEPDWPAQCVLFVGSMNGRREFVSADWLRDRDWVSVAHASRAALAESLAAFCELEQLQ